ncbi:hypothetical protein CAAN1_01S09978 [[Candida] anglica]|uniref:Uncharacterized protein n=1 Tax=[Candida] anglica TaxID=148631 RepID=A0ABP0EK73_9ASCO
MTTFTTVTLKRHDHHHHKRNSIPTQTNTETQVVNVVQRDASKTTTTSSTKTKDDSKTTTTSSTKTKDNSKTTTTSSTKTNDDKPKITTTSDSETETALPTLSMPSLSTSTTSYSYSLTVPNSEPTQSSGTSSTSNPYIYRTNLPDNLVFIVIGAVIGFLLITILVVRTFISLSARRRAKADSEKYVHNSNGIFFSGGDYTSCNSSFIDFSEKSPYTNSSASSLHLLAKNAASNISDSSSSNASSQGRTYMNSVQGKNAMDQPNNRGSMYISPVLEVMNQNRSQYQLPVQHKGIFDNRSGEVSAIGSGFGSDGNMSGSDTGLLDDFEISLELPDELDDDRSTMPKLSRTPSQILDNFLDNI